MQGPLYFNTFLFIFLYVSLGNSVALLGVGPNGSAAEPVACAH